LLRSRGFYFESRRGAVVARYGNTTLPAPRYDLEAVRDKVQIATCRRRRGATRAPRTRGETGAAGAAVANCRRGLDRSLFGISGRFRGDAGLVALPLDAPVLAHSANPRQRFGDVRIVDADGRQIPYLVERASEPLSIDLTLERLRI
jgi:hypothetical protein